MNREPGLMDRRPPFESGEREGHRAPPLDACIQVMGEAHGRDLSRFDETFLAKSLHQRLTVTSTETWPVYLDRLAHDGTEAEALLQSLHPGYSEFFRNPLTFALLEQHVLPGLVEAREATGSAELRVWSAGCAAGQEAWSVAILLEELAAARGRPIQFRILATDISDAELALAREGVYGYAAARNVRLRHLRDYLSAKGETYVVAPRLRDRVDFSTYDLLDERSVCPPASLYGDFDLVLCCNLLFYYRPDLRERILDKVCRALRPSGCFVTGEVERDLAAGRERFRAVLPPSAVFQKGGLP